jgi:serine/threonine-protein kinase
VVQSLKTGERKTVIDGGSDGRYLPTGHLVYARGAVVFVVPMDIRRLVVRVGDWLYERLSDRGELR